MYDGSALINGGYTFTSGILVDGDVLTANGPASPTFSITGDGFVFESGQYVLQPYAVGIVDFEIPASDFGEALTADIFD